MAWIKRNLFFAVGGLVAFLLLGAAGFYDYRGWSHNAAAFDRLNEIYTTLHKLATEKILPGNDKINNIQAAKDQEREVRAWINQAVNYFKPITPIPNSTNVTSEAYAAALRRTIDLLQREADTASVQLPPKYAFSFEAQRQLVVFAPGSLDSLAVQLGEVKTISEILFVARVNGIDSIQRVRASDDDIAGSAADYLNDVSVTNDLAILTPYAVTVRCFSTEIASMLAGFAASPNGFIVKGLNISPAGMNSQPGAPGAYGEGAVPPSMTPPPMTVPGRGGLPTVINEQLLHVTLEVEIVKPLPQK
jgi:hypothetical protein